jgi:mannose-6-phosphate isomerase-like protein (cupin superfamily)
MEMLLGPPPSFGPPLHTHPHAETFIVLSGRVELQAGERRVVAEAGAIVVAPGGTPHTFVNRGEGESRVLVIFSPGGFEAYFREAKELLKGGPPTPELMQKLSAKYNQEIVGSPLS